MTGMQAAPDLSDIDAVAQSATLADELAELQEQVARLERSLFDLRAAARVALDHHHHPVLAAVVQRIEQEASQ